MQTFPCPLGAGPQGGGGGVRFAAHEAAVMAACRSNEVVWLRLR